MAIWRAVVRIAHPSIGGFGSNTWHMRTLGGEVSLPTVLSAHMEAVHQFYTDAATLFPNNAHFSFDGGFHGVGEDEGDYVEGDLWNRDGGASADIIPPSNCIVVGWRTASGGRQGRGRTFLGPITDPAAATDGTPEGAALTTVRTAAANLVEYSDSAGNGALGVWSVLGAEFRDFVGSAVRDQFAVLRSRRD